MTAIGDPEDGRPSDSARVYPEDGDTINPPGFSGPEEVTQTAIPSPQPRKETRAVTLADIFDAIGELAVKLDTLNHRVGGIDAGLSAAWTEIAALRGDMGTGFDGVIARQIAHGTVLAQIATDVGLLREQADSALGAVGKMGTRFERLEQRQEQTLRVAKAAYNVALHGQDGIDDEERAAIAAIR